MSFLAPLYFLGALAIAGPILFHLIRRQRRGEVEFSSLMFLDPTPPRLTKRSRLENWPLLLLRCAAILMLAFAFARPYLPLSESESVDGVKQAIVLLVDQSASMQRNGLWDQATRKVDQLLDDSDDETLISVIGFDSRPQIALSLEESTKLVADMRAGAARDAFAKLSPTWQATDLGQAIRFAADQAALFELDDSAGSSTAAAGSAALETRIVLLSDLQSGAAIETLQGYEWPQRVWLDVLTLTPQKRGNASLRVLPQPTGDEQADTQSTETTGPPTGKTVRVQVSQTEDASDPTLQLRFDGQTNSSGVIQVPPGQSRFFSVELPDVEGGQNGPVETATLQLAGDGQDFDNSFHFIRPKRIEQEVRCFDSRRASGTGPKAVRETLSFYAEQIPWSDSSREVSFRVQSEQGGQRQLDPLLTPLLIFDGSTEQMPSMENLQRYLRGSGRAVIVIDRAVDETMRETLATLLDSPRLTIEKAEDSDYRLIASVDFKTALIAPLADPGVNDFSNIRIWTYNKISGLGEQTSVTLRLDDGSPLLIRREFASDDLKKPAGKLWVLSTGWQPSQSQLALSTKFVPLLIGMLGPNRQMAPESRWVGDRVEDDQVASEPGIVTLSGGEKVAVNLNPLESETSPIDVDRLAEFGAMIASPASREQDRTAERALRDIELESRQGWWQWLILATLGLIAAETLLAARSPRGRQGLEA
jgi:hypothetical protein